MLNELIVSLNIPFSTRISSSGRRGFLTKHVHMTGFSTDATIEGTKCNCVVPIASVEPVAPVASAATRDPFHTAGIECEKLTRSTLIDFNVVAVVAAEQHCLSFVSLRE